MHYEVVQNDAVAQFIVKGDIDEVGAQELKTCFEGLNLSALEGVVFDFAGVTRIGSAGLGKLLLFYKKLAAADATLKIERANTEIRGLLVELNLNTLFTIT